MSIFRLCGYSAFVPKPPAFVIPMFLSRTSNFPKVQDLDAFGNITSFMDFDPDSFFSISALPPPLERSIGQPGILAFWVDDETILVGTFAELRSELSHLDQADLPAFVAVEAMSFLAKPAELTKAAHRASAFLKNNEIRNAYTKRVHSWGHSLEELRLTQLSKEDEENRTLEEVLADLESHIPDKEWSEIWTWAWQRFKRDDRLSSIAEWKIDSQGLGEFESRIIQEMIIYDWGSKAEAFAVRWLNRREFQKEGWLAVWNSLSYRPHRKREILGCAVEYFDWFLSSKTPSTYSLLLVWKSIWESTEEYQDKLLIVAEHLNGSHVHIDWYVEIVLLPLLDKKRECNWALDQLRKWLFVPRSLATWVNAYIKYTPVFDSEKYHLVGAEWLRRYGGGMNLWLNLWRHTRSWMPIHQSLHLAEDWLLRARKDLTSWPQVFAETLKLAQEMGESSPKLILSARSWLEHNHDKKDDQVIEAVAHGRAPAGSA